MWQWAARQAGRKSVRQAGASLVLCGPAVVLYVGFFVLPALLGFTYSLTDWSGWEEAPSFVGLQNFRELLVGSAPDGRWAPDERFLLAIKFTLFETVLIVLFFTFATMVLAVLLDGLRIMKGLVRGLFFYPYILSVLVSALLFQYLVNYRDGAINAVQRALHLDAVPVAWLNTLEPLAVLALRYGHMGFATLLSLTEPDALCLDWMGSSVLVPYFIFALVAWSGLGFFTTLYLANLQTIPGELYEAACIDGAGPLETFAHIQLPMLLPTLTTNSVLALITGINLFPQIVVTTQGGPGYRTSTIGYFIYHQGVLSNRQGYAAAASFVTFCVLVAVAVLQVMLLRRRHVTL